MEWNEFEWIWTGIWNGMNLNGSGPELDNKTKQKTTKRAWHMHTQHLDS